MNDSTDRVETIRERRAKLPETPWFVAADDARECGPHTNSGLALVDTGRESDWPIARLCYWPIAEFIANAPDDIDFLLAENQGLRKRVDAATNCTCDDNEGTRRCEKLIGREVAAAIRAGRQEEGKDGE